MTSQAFCEWIFEKCGVTICCETARSWLHNLGFSQKNHHKGVYVDGHDVLTVFPPVYLNQGGPPGLTLG